MFNTANNLLNLNQCRLCLKNDEIKLIDFPDENVENSLNIIKKHFWFLILDNEEKICQSCWSKTLDFHSFYTNIECIQKQLYAKLFNNEQKLNSNLKIKSENDGDTLQVKIDDIAESDQLADDDIKDEDDGDYTEIQEESKLSSYLRRSQIAVLMHPNANPNFKCEKCGKECLDSTKLKRHMNIHLAAYRPYQCDKCSNDFKTKLQLDKHLYVKHSISKADDNAQQQLSIHNKTKKLNPKTLKPAYIKSGAKRNYTDPEINEKIRHYFAMNCDICNCDMNTFRLAKRHYRLKHNKNGYIVCCGKKFFQRYRVIDHTLQHINPKNFYKCEPCGKEFTDRRTLKYHMETHIPNHLRPFHCTQCDKRFILQYDLTRHNRITHYTEDDKKFPCSHCEKLFVSKSIRDAHVRLVHEFVYAQICDICARVFKTKQQLDHHHVSVHTDTPKVQCDICGVWLKNYLCLPQHNRRHKNSEPFECPTCHKVFRNKDVYKDHKRSMHSTKKSVSCMLCKKEFKSEGRLREHMTQHTGQNLYTCEYCSLGFKRNSSRHRHRKKVHFEEWLRDRKPPHTAGQIININ